ncbi:hypothetical protein Rhe02_67790 [Rhizocola hellebori]|uniref:Uncharacterized protein n=1 Tax=Rhizocola hellebori TaxID=1392758 RepID=A0A8J3VJP6_9ACTN|nr:hypothetical protein Rhe02_67790 [Rhizocola hellebori]
MAQTGALGEHLCDVGEAGVKGGHGGIDVGAVTRGKDNYLTYVGAEECLRTVHTRQTFEGRDSGSVM